MEPRCSVCGRSMRNDTFSGNLVCQRCGNEFGITDEISEGTYEEARAHVRNLRFDQAIKILNSLDKAAPNVMLLNLLCCYQAEDTGVLVDKVSKSPEKVKLLLMRKDVNLMAQSDDSRVKDYISHVLEYCFVELALAGVDISDLREKLNAQNTPVRKKPVQKQMSAFAKMDAEESAAAFVLPHGPPDHPPDGSLLHAPRTQFSPRNKKRRGEAPAPDMLSAHP